MTAKGAETRSLVRIKARPTVRAYIYDTLELRHRLDLRDVVVYQWLPHGGIARRSYQVSELEEVTA